MQCWVVRGNRLFRPCSVTQPLGCFRFHFPSPHVPSRCTTLPPTPRIILVSLLPVITFFAALWPPLFVDVGHVLTSDTAATSLKRSRFEDPTKPTFHCLAPLIYCQSLRFSFIPSSSSECSTHLRHHSQSPHSSQRLSLHTSLDLQGGGYCSAS